MIRTTMFWLPLLAVAVCWGAAARADSPSSAATVEIGPLAEYVAQTDDYFGWEIRDEGKIGRADYVEVVLRSQQWRDVVWKHHLVVIKPQSLAADCRNALFFIGGGSWRPENDQPPGADRRLPSEAVALAAAAESLGTPICVLSHVPHQPLFDGLHEDEIISLTFAKFYETGDTTWPLLLPMVKSAVRGMDAVQEICDEKFGVEVESFTVTGASKRGWTTWLTSAVDPRVTALAPMVIDVLNMPVQMKHQVASFGGYSEQIADYTEKGLQQQMDSERGEQLNAIVDPFAYREVIEQPKLLILGSNDRYWPLDACNLYWDGLAGDRYVLYCPNQGHGIKDLPRVIGGLSALHRQATGEAPLPTLDWSYRPGEQGVLLEFSSDESVAEARVWTTTSASRDFRDSTWTPSQVARDVDGSFRYSLPHPAEGYAAVFGEYEFHPEGESPFFLSTNVRIVSPEGVVVPEVQVE